MDAIISQLQDLVEGQIDFQGQKLSEMISTVMLSVISAIALLVGYVQRDIHLAMWTLLVGTAATLLLVVPPWPFYNQHPQPWIGSRGKLNLPHGGIVVSGVKVS